MTEKIKKKMQKTEDEDKNGICKWFADEEQSELMWLQRGKKIINLQSEEPINHQSDTTTSLRDCYRRINALFSEDKWRIVIALLGWWFVFELVVGIVDIVAGQGDILN